MCYVGKATKIFIFIVTVLVVTGLVLGLGFFQHGIRKSHRCSGDVCHSTTPDQDPNPNPAPIGSNPVPPSSILTPNPYPPPSTDLNPPPDSTQNPVLPPPPPVTESQPPPPAEQSLLPPPPDQSFPPLPPAVAAPPAIPPPTPNVGSGTPGPVQG